MILGNFPSKRIKKAGTKQESRPFLLILSYKDTVFADISRRTWKPARPRATDEHRLSPAKFGNRIYIH